MKRYPHLLHYCGIRTNQKTIYLFLQDLVNVVMIHLICESLFRKWSNLLLNVLCKTDKSSQWPITNLSHTLVAWQYSGALSHTVSGISDHLINFPATPVILSNSPTTSNWAFHTFSFWYCFILNLLCILTSKLRQRKWSYFVVISFLSSRKTFSINTWSCKWIL